MTAFGKDQREARLRRLELHALEEMQAVLRLLYECHYMPDRVRDLITMCCVWGASIGQDARIDDPEYPKLPPPPPRKVEVIELVWDEDDIPTEPMPVVKPDAPTKLTPVVKPKEPQ